jgi:uncharacterized protein (TIGR02996 family)
MANEGDTILRAVLRDPVDDAPRLVYADWLEDHGQPERAEFIRLQCGLPKLEGIYGELEKETKSHPLGRGPGAASLSCWCATCGRREDAYAAIQDSLRRQVELLAGSPTSWGANGQFSDWLSSFYPRHDMEGVKWSHARGFVSRVELPTAGLLAHAGVLFSAHPIEEVRLTDRESGHVQHRRGGTSVRWVWWNERLAGHETPTPSTPPSVLFPGLPGGRLANFKSEGEANGALSRRCVSFGRERAAEARLARRAGVQAGRTR